MDWYALLLFVHILLLVFWLGTDIGVFVLGKFAQNPDYTVDQRLLLLKVALILDIFPRICMVLILPTGYQLTVFLGAIDAGQYLTLGIWLFSGIWLAIVLAGMVWREQAVGQNAKTIEKIMHYLLVLVLGWVGLASLFSGSPITMVWIAIKVLIFVLIIICALLLEKVFHPAIMGFIQLEKEGSSAELEKQIRGGMDRTYVWVLAIYGLVVAAAYLGVLKPGF